MRRYEQVCRRFAHRRCNAAVSARAADQSRNVRIRNDLAGLQVRNETPYVELKRRSVEFQRDVERAQPLGEVRPDLPSGFAQQGIARP